MRRMLLNFLPFLKKNQFYPIATVIGGFILWITEELSKDVIFEFTSTQLQKYFANKVADMIAGAATYLVPIGAIGLGMYAVYHLAPRHHSTG